MHFIWTTLSYAYLALQVLLASWLVQPLILLLVYGITRLLGIRPHPTPFHSVTRDYQFGIVITAHRETAFLPPIIDSLLKQTHTRFNVYIVADDCDTSRLVFRDPRIHILRPPVPLHDQLASLDFGWRHLDRQDEVLIIFDPDNLVHPDFLRTLNAWYNSGYRAVVGHMQSKNRETTYAQIDGWGASLSNFMERDMRSLLGLSPNISGSGISVHKEVYDIIHYDRRSRTGGFDKQLQMGTVKAVHRIAYARDALFYDEKVGDSHNFERQRIRWIAAHFKFLGNAFHLLLTGIRKRDGNLVYFGYNLIRPPWFILLTLSFLMMATDWLIDPRLSIAWLACFAAFSLSFLLIVAKDISNKSPVKALANIPRIFYRQFRALLRLRLNKTSLLKTTHSELVYIDDIIRPQAQPQPPANLTPSSANFARPPINHNPSPANFAQPSANLVHPPTTAASTPPPAPASTTQNPPPGYASSPPSPGEDKKPDYAHSRSSRPIFPST